MPTVFQRTTSCLTAFLALVVGAAGAAAAADDAIDQSRRSIVRIHVVAQVPDYSLPWNPGQLKPGKGTGFAIADRLVMTNAHLASNARFIAVEREGDPRRYAAKVKHVAHDCDLALLEVDDDAFFQDMPPLALGGVPSLDSTVTVLGYPIGGSRLSVTRGVVSRIDFHGYAHSGVDSHLAIQIDAAINPGNSGGPVLQDGAVVGVAFQGFAGSVAQNVGYMIPTPVIRRFLEDVADGRYDHYVDLGAFLFPLVNGAQRRALGLSADGDDGVMVSRVAAAGAAAGRLRIGDVLLRIDGRPIFSDGTVDMDGERMMLNEVVERKFKGDTVHLQGLRDRRGFEEVLPLNSPWPYLMAARRHDVRPRFVLFGGLVFQPLSNGFMRAAKTSDINVLYHYTHFLESALYLERPEVIVIGKILPDPINAYLEDAVHRIVDRINEVPIRRLEDVARALADPAPFTAIHFLGSGRPAVLERQAVEEARERILDTYGVTRESWLQDSIVPPDWEAARETNDDE